MRFPPRRKLAIAGVVLAACSFGGGAYAASQDSRSPSSQAFVADAAKRLGVSPQQLTAALEGAMTDQLNAAVKAGKLSQAQANALKRRIRRRGRIPFGPLGLGPGAFLRLHADVVPFGAAAKYLGISAAQLRSELRSGKTLKQIASEHGKSVAGLRQAIRSAMPKLEAPRLFAPHGRFGPPPPFIPPPTN